MKSQFAFPVEIEGRCLLEIPATPEWSVLALHGYGQSPEVLLPLVRRLVGDGPAIGALAAPFPMYDRLGTGGETVYHWGTRHHWDLTVRTHHRMVLHVLKELEACSGIRNSRTILLGFSQPVGLNYRFAGTYPGSVRGVIGICGGVPSRWEEEAYQPVTASLLHIARSEDEFYPAEVARSFPDRLRHHAADVDFHMLPGGHRFPSQAGPMVKSWLERLAGAPWPA